MMLHRCLICVWAAALGNREEFGCWHMERRLIFPSFDYCIFATNPARTTHHQDGRTALIRAAAEGAADCVRVLLEAGADTKGHLKVRDNDAVAHALRKNVMFISRC